MHIYPHVLHHVQDLIRIQVPMLVPAPTHFGACRQTPLAGPHTPLAGLQTLIAGPQTPLVGPKAQHIDTESR